MQKEQQELANLIKGKKVAFIGAGVSHRSSATTQPPSRSWASA